jgi:hypothetical protein
MRNTNRKNKQWLRNRDQRKNPKVYQVSMVRNPDGSFHLLGGESKVLIRKNQHGGEWVNVDTRDLTCEIRNSRITSY